MEVEQTSIRSDTNSTCEYLDAEGEPESPSLYQEADPDQEAEQQNHSIISELRDGLSSSRDTSALSPEPGQQNKGLAASEESLAISTSTSAKTEDSIGGLEEEYDYQNDSLWQGQKKHIFILSEAGKPIFSLHGNEDKLATLFGVIQALVSFVQMGQDAITSIHAAGIKFAFMQRSSLILVAATRSNMSVQQLQLQLG